MATTIHNRFEPAKNHERILFRQDRVLQSAELNELQSASAHRITGLANALFKDGDIIRDARIIVSADTGVTQCEAGAIYLSGAVRGVPASTIAVPVVGIVNVGVYLRAEIVSEEEDASLLNPAAGARGYMEPGALREVVTPAWGFQGDGQVGNFYPVWVVEDGYVRPKEAPPNLDSVTQALARYDRDSTGGSYIVSGMAVAIASDLESGQQVYTISEGRARVNGYGVEQLAARRVVFAATPDIKAIDSEPHLSATEGAQRINLDRAPAQGVPTVRITARRTVDVVHGGFSGAADPLPDSSVIAIEAVQQGGTTFTLTADYKLTAGQVDWSPAGAEPNPGSTYQVTYRYIQTVPPTDVDPYGFEVVGALEDTLVLVSYNQMLRRIDRLCLAADGALSWVVGVSAEWSPAMPAVPSDLLPLASVYQSWDTGRRVVLDGTRVVSMEDIVGQARRLDRVVEDQAELRLAVDIQGRHSGIKKGLFADPFISDGMRDAGVAQSGAIVGGALRLPLSVSVFDLADGITTAQAPAHGYSVAIQQPLRTGAMQVNPYMAFNPLPGVCTLTPSVDRWTETTTQWTSAVTERLYTGAGGSASYSHAYSSTAVVSQSSTDLEYLREIPVRFHLKGFAPGEGLASVTFDGIGVAPHPLPGGTLIASAGGEISGTFDIPAQVPAGTKNVTFEGAGGSNASQFFVGQGTATTRVQRQVNTEVWTYTEPVSGGGFVIGPAGGSSAAASNPCAGKFVIGPSTDPLAQTFTTAESVHMAGCDLWFTAKDTEVVVQIRETQVGMPTSTILAEKRVQAADIATDGTATRVTWTPVALTGGREYALVVLCDDATTSLQIAELGKVDSDAGRWITSQPYQVGVLLSSSNANTWTVHQDRDLRFRLLAAAYTEAERVIDLGTADLVAATDLMVLGYADRPSAEAELVFELVFPGGEIVRVGDGQVIWLAAPFTGSVHVFARLRGGERFAAVLQPGVQLVAGQIQTTATYVTPMVNAGTDSQLKVVFEAEIPGGASVHVHVQTDAPGAPWEEVPYVSAGSATAGVREIVHELADISADKLRVRLALAGHTGARPSVRNLRAIVL